jgi:hypothetical protein
MNITTLFDNLSTKLGLLKAKRGIENSTNEYSLNQKLENTFIQILNIVYKSNILNANEIKTNYPGIDGIDENSKTVYQITSTFSKEKILNTIEKCIANKEIDKNTRLNFFFLQDIKRLNKKTKIEIQNLISDKIQFDAEKDLMDSNTIYQKLYYKSNPEEVIEVIKILDNLLGTLPLNKISSYTSIAISFEEDENTNAYNLIDAILKQGINVYISSKHVYQMFLANKHRFFDYLVYIDDVEELDHIKNYLVIVSKKYVLNNLTKDIKCIFLKRLQNNDYKRKVICFDPYIDNLKDIKINAFKKPYTVSTNKLSEFTKELFDNYFKSLSVDIEFSIDDIIDELKNIYPNFKIEKLGETNQLKSLKFFMPGMDMEMIYVILKNNYSPKDVSESIGLISKKYSNVNVLVPKRMGAKTRKQLDNIRAKVNLKNINFIDEFLFESSLMKIDQQKLLHINDFVDPVIKKNGDIIHLNDILNWITEESYPSVSIIKAPGGIGKTTLSEKIHDLLIQDSENNFLVLFIESSLFIENFRHSDFDDDEDYDLYNIYKKCYAQDNLIDEVTFNNNYSHGNILMIIDGVDEIVSTISNFSLDEFLKRLSLLNTKIGKGKILITCRDIYIDGIANFLRDSKLEGDSIAIYELLPFNEKLARIYFSKHVDSSSKIEKCINLLDKFIIVNESDDYKYPPFILGVIIDFISQNGDNDINLNDIFNSEYLQQNYNNDFVIHQIFKREVLKKQVYGYDLSIDTQVQFFSLMAVSKNGSLEFEDIEELLEKIDHTSNLSYSAKGLIDHPFLKKKNETFYFSYKFLKVEFYVISILNVIKDNNFMEVNDSLINLLAYKFNYNSIISKGVLKKVQADNYFDERKLILALKQLIEKIKSTDVKENSKRKAISNIFLLFCEYCREKKIYSNSGYLSNIDLLFSEKGDEFISEFYLIDVSDDMDLKLDLRNLFFDNSQITNYSNLLRCKFDKNTCFIDSCFINNISIPSNFLIEEMSMSKDNFYNIRGDNSIHKYLRLKTDGKATIEYELREFLKLFYKGKNLITKIPKKKIKSNASKITSEQKIIEALSISNIITDTSDNHFTINKDLISKINKFIFQGRTFLEINKAYRNMLSNY